MHSDWAMALNNKDEFDCIYFDYNKAFDRVNHSMLLKKLCDLGIDTRTYNWIKSYLTKRSFVVKVNEFLSDPSPCPSGVPQGSCLGPILFSIFVLDLKDNLPNGLNHKF